MYNYRIQPRKHLKLNQISSSVTGQMLCIEALPPRFHVYSYKHLPNSEGSFDLFLNFEKSSAELNGMPMLSMIC